MPFVRIEEQVMVQAIKTNVSKGLGVLVSANSNANESLRPYGLANNS
jgi:hypothetical protein